MHSTLARRALGGLVPPKIASPKLLSGASPSGAGPLAPLVAFYYKLPKGPAPTPAFRGLKARYFSGKNASAAPVLWLIGGLFLVGYTLDYQLHLKHHKHNAH
ncbi:mitochondrial F1-F0 ATP synthase subunit F of fungi-domain-containing protein [Mycena polygramma]|nr:mitochondrial F1-F0 ATP synthase subunit F of fungi-domain-containing protein [Mycena polygramma]